MKIDPHIEILQQQRHALEQLLLQQKRRVLSVFSQDLEAQFWQDREERLITSVLRAFVPVTLIYFAFEIVSLPLNFFLTQVEHRVHDVGMTMISYTTGWLALLSIYIVARHPQLRQHYGILVGAVIAIGMTIVQSVLFALHDGNMVWRGSLLIVMIWAIAYMCSGVRPKWTFIAGMLSSVLTCIVLALNQIKIPTLILSNSLILGNLVGLALAVMANSTERIRFLQGKMLELDQQIHQRLNHYLLQISQQDTLTLLGNRRSLDQYLVLTMQEIQRKQSCLAVLFIDVDFFKSYNDIYGHQAGDIALVRVAKTLLRHVNDQDLAVRYGGEEFVVVLKHINLEQAKRIAEDILNDIRQQNIVHAEPQSKGYLTLSIGLSTYRDEPYLADDVLKLADLALYQAKHAGRDQYQILDDYFYLHQHMQSDFTEHK